MPIPNLDEHGQLPPGEHLASLDEVEQRFAGPESTYRRRERMKDLRWAVERLIGLGVKRIWVDGSFVTDDPRPKDVDVVYEPESEPSTWPSVFHPTQRKQLKKLHNIDLWMHPTKVNDRGRPLPIEDFFQQDRDGRPKGIILLDLNGGTDDQEPIPSGSGQAPDS